MTITNVLAGLGVRDLAAAERWYAGLLGRAPDARPMDELIEYRLPTGGWLQLFEDKDRAGHGSLTLVVDDFDAALASLAAKGIAHDPPMRGDYVDTGIFADPDGNRIVFAQSRSGDNKAAS